jgi:hypothetical protein
MPVIKQSLLPAAQKDLTCPSPFLKEKYQLTYAIEIQAAGNVQGAIIGITVVDPSTRFVSCAIMTVEGMVLFDAEAGPGTLKINRALPPFASADFANNMIEDINLISFAPEGKILAKGTLPDGAIACRYLEESGDWIDLITDKSGEMAIKRFSSSADLKRQVRYNKKTGNIYQSIELQEIGIVNYTLLMTLIDAHKVESVLTGEKSKVKK